MKTTVVHVHTICPRHFFTRESLQQQLNGSPNGLVEPFALAVPSRVVGGGRAERNDESGEVRPRLLTDKR